MCRAEKLYTGAVLCEEIVLFLNSVLSLVWLWRLEAEQRMAQLRWMVLAALIISCVLIPVQSAVLRAYQKRRAGREKYFQARLSRIVLSKMSYVFGALWLTHFASVEIMAARYGWRHGSDIYMYYSRPGSRIIFLSLVGMAVVGWIVDRERD